MMLRRFLTIAMLAAVFACVACGGDEGATPGGGESPAAATATGAEAGPTTQTTEETGCEPPRETEIEERPGGTYTTSEFQPPFTIDFGEQSFFVLSPEACDVVAFLDVDGLEGTYLNVVNDAAIRADPALEIQEPQALPPDPAAGDIDLATWLHQHPRLQTTEEQPVTVAGLEGIQFDAEVDPSKAYETPACEGFECVVVLGLRGEAYHLPVENKWRLIALDVEGEQVVLLLEASKADFDEWTGNAETILSTLSF